MSKSCGSPSTPRPSSRTRSTGTPPRVGPAVAVEERAGDPADEVGVEALVAGRDRGVDGEDAVPPDLAEGVRRAVPPAATCSRARSARRNAEWPSLRCQTAGSMPRARIARTPPTPRTSSWWRRISRPRTYRMFVIGRSAGSLSGRSVSRRRTGTRPTWATQTATARSRPGSGHGHPERIAVRVGRPEERQPGEVVVGVGVLLVAVGVDRLAEVALAVEQADADERAGPCPWPTSCGRRRGRRGRRSRSRVTRGTRTRRRSRRSARRGPPRTGGGTSGPRRSPCSGRSRR